MANSRGILSVDADFVTQAISKEIKGEIQFRIEKTLIDSIMPDIKKIAEETAIQICKNGSVFFAKQYGIEGDRLTVQVNFIDPKDYLKAAGE